VVVGSIPTGVASLQHAMSTRDIRRKLTAKLDKGITTEVQVVYVLAGVRKLIERDKIEDEYTDLRFHCDWALHSSLSWAAVAKAILREFDAAHALLKAGQRLPLRLKVEIDRISKMRSFEKELFKFLAVYELPSLTKNNPDGWAHFLHLYAKVIEDIPLTVYVPSAGKKKKDKKGPSDSAPKHISHVTVHFEQARDWLKDGGREEVLFTVTWRLHDKNGKSGDIPVYHSFSRIEPRTAQDHICL
jgi:hypothetical protein